MSSPQITATLLKVLFCRRTPLSTIFQLLPSQFITSACVPCPLLPEDDSPTAHTSSAAIAATSFKLLIGPTFGVGTIFHAEPSQCIAVVCQRSVPLWCAPTAHTSC